MINQDIPDKSMDTTKNLIRIPRKLFRTWEPLSPPSKASCLKPKSVLPRTTPCHLKDRVVRLLNEMVEQDVIEEHPTNEPAPWVS